MARTPPVQFGDRFGRLVVIGRGEDKRNAKGHVIYHARVACVCGTQFSVAEKSLKDGNTKSCGCFKTDNLKVAPRNLRHGMVGTPAYRSWQGMKDRCLNPQSIPWLHYGGRGITICDRWLRFENFYADMGPRPEGMSLDRIDVNGDYEPKNCRWATDEVQASNQRHTKLVMLRGNIISFSKAAKELGRVPATLRQFAKENGYTHQEAVDRYKKRRGK